MNTKENCKKKDKVENNPIKYSLIANLMLIFSRTSLGSKKKQKKENGSVF